MKVTIRGITECFITMIMGMLIWMLISCVTINPRLIEKNLEMYKNEFVAMTRFKESDFNYYSIKFGSLIEPTIGMCNTITREIVIDPSFWYESSEKRRTALMFHEFGHCLCKLWHDSEKRKDKCPISIMNPSIPSQKCLNRHWPNYVKDFLKRCK